MEKPNCCTIISQNRVLKRAHLEKTVRKGIILNIISWIWPSRETEPSGLVWKSLVLFFEPNMLDYVQKRSMNVGSLLMMWREINRVLWGWRPSDMEWLLHDQFPAFCQHIK